MSNNPFDYVSDASFEKANIWDDQKSEKEYVPFITNRAFSYHIDALMDANTMNMLWELPPKMQYFYYLNVLPKRRRFSKWFKPEKDDLLMAVQHAYNLNPKKAKAMIPLLTDAEKAACLAWNRKNKNNGK